MSVNAYFRPTTIAEALDLLNQYKGNARLVAGATDLFLDIEKKKKAPEALVDVRTIKELHEVKEEDGRLFIGAAVTHTELENNSLVNKHFKALALGASVVGGPAIRNVGTIGGNVINAQPAADTAVPLFAFDAVCVVCDADGEKEVPIAELYAGPGKSNLDASKQLLKGFYLKTGEYNVSGFARQAKRKALALPMLNMAAALKIRCGKITKASLSAGPVSTTPLRLTEAEAYLVGKAPSKEVFAEAGRLAEEQASPRDSMLRGSAEFRKELLGIMMAELLETLCSK